ncbi:MAG: hypothetical protein LBR71_07775 [Synergistaceae bacterium]|nr:hypothetical protein [Synergistaceae bacterium]
MPTAMLEREEIFQIVRALPDEKVAAAAELLRRFCDDSLLAREIAEFQAAGRPLDFTEKERLRQKYVRV